MSGTGDTGRTREAEGGSAGSAPAAPPGRRPVPVPVWHHVTDDAGPGPGSSRSASRRPAMWIVLAGVLLATVVAVLVDARAGCLVLAGVLVAAGLARAFLPGPGPVGISVRSRGLDTFFFLAPAVAIAFLALTTPGVVPQG
ncbi:DUF3017 domain-containing protein [Cellulosimicrobium arenosum]|uniref:DUF3017 domain-containing protein n=1 Tax=Cellulosimicrobium arenosum TaxID=2708133 RepID=A0A927G7E6_9MICO|nr:DUF3017 domain-containing protein [Cellulosimicrobium arenosum]MBD8078272.1 DUF3017 domain-containing protein [Cellulosimicrobium arenosum]